MRALLYSLSLLLAAFSVGTQAANTKEPAKIALGLDINLTVPPAWYFYPRPYNMVMTRDGILLQSISISKFAYGEKLPNINRPLMKDALLSENGELYIQSIENDSEVANFERQTFEPYVFKGQDGFQLVYRYQVSGSTWMRAQVIVLMTENWIYQITYTGTDRVYFDRGLDGFQSVLSSLELLKL